MYLATIRPCNSLAERPALGLGILNIVLGSLYGTWGVFKADNPQFAVLAGGFGLVLCVAGYFGCFVIPPLKSRIAYLADRLADLTPKSDGPPN